MSWEKDADAIWAKTRSYREGCYYIQLARAYSPQPLYYSVSVEIYGEKFRSREEAEKHYDKIRISNKADDGDVVGKKLYYWGEHDTIEVIKVDKTRDRRYCQHVDNYL